MTSWLSAAYSTYMCSSFSRHAGHNLKCGDVKKNPSKDLEHSGKWSGTSKMCIRTIFFSQQMHPITPSQDATRWESVFPTCHTTPVHTLNPWHNPSVHTLCHHRAWLLMTRALTHAVDNLTSAPLDGKNRGLGWMREGRDVDPWTQLFFFIVLSQTQCNNLFS